MFALDENLNRPKCHIVFDFPHNIFCDMTSSHMKIKTEEEGLIRCGTRRQFF